MEDPRVRKLAKYMIHEAVQLQKGEKILIEVHGQAKEMARALIEESYAAGGNPYFHQFDYDLEGVVMRGASPEHMAGIAKYELDRMRDMDAYVDIRVFDNIYKWKSIPEEQAEIYRKYYWGPLHLSERCQNTKWVVTHFPNSGAAQLFNMSTWDYEDFYFRAALVDYTKMGQALAPLRDMLRKTDKVHITGPGTDLTFSIKGIGCTSSYGQKNIPDGEVTSCPVRESINGVLTYNVPSPYDGLMFENIKLTFRDGKIVEAECPHYTDRLNKILDVDEGARYIGEFSFGVNPELTVPVGDILFDEKMAGSFHFTPGNCYETSDNGNHSALHWDLICQQLPEYGGGEISLDGRRIRKDGRFVVPELECLNPENLK